MSGQLSSVVELLGPHELRKGGGWLASTDVNGIKIDGWKFISGVCKKEKMKASEINEERTRNP